MLKQRVFQIASGYEDGNDADTLRADPLFKLAAGRAPLETGNPLACGATHSRLEGSLRRSDIYRTAKALIKQFVATYSEAPGSITLDTQGIGPVVSSVRLFGEFDYAAKSWPQAHRVVLKAEVLTGNNGLPAKDISVTWLRRCAIPLLAHSTSRCIASADKRRIGSNK